MGPWLPFSFLLLFEDRASAPCQRVGIASSGFLGLAFDLGLGLGLGFKVTNRFMVRVRVRVRVTLYFALSHLRGAQIIPLQYIQISRHD